MFATLLATRIVQYTRRLAEQARAAIRLPQQQTAAIAGDMSAGKNSIDFSAFTGWKFNLGRGTIGHGDFLS
jgi:hypothetical protein